MNSGQLFHKETQALIYGRQVQAAQRMLDFDFVCGREKPSVAAFVEPGKKSFEKLFFGTKEILVPVYETIEVAAKAQPKANVLINFASMRSAYESSKEVIAVKSIRTIVIIAEGVPERRTRELIVLAEKAGKVIIGPATVGGIRAGAFRIGNTGGTIESMIEAKLQRPGSVGFVAKSGGMSNEMYNVIAKNSDGIVEGISIGGDRFAGSTLISHLERFEKDAAIKFYAVLGELGGDEEYAIVEALEKKKIKKPLVIWVAGTCAKVFATEVQFGHAGAMASGERETADAKNAALRKAGAIVPKSFDDFGEVIGKVYRDLKKKGVIKDIIEVEPAVLTKVRRATNFLCSISDDRGDDAKYGSYTISEIIERKMSLGEVISILWFKKKLPIYATDFLEMVLKIVADHGPAVSGAHNAIVAARADKDLVSSLVSGLLTIGPRFGGAIDGAAYYFSDAFSRALSAADFVKEMKAKNINIPGIGHRVKSVRNPDRRVILLKVYAKKFFKETLLLDYVLEVEKITTSKKENLILNVDGTIAALFIDMMRSCGVFNKEEMDEVIKNGALNGLFVLGRSIGIIGHILDQKRFNQGLYRHPTDDILYLEGT